MTGVGRKGSRSWWDRAVTSGKEAASARSLLEDRGSKPDEVVVRYARIGVRAATDVQDLRASYGPGIIDPILFKKLSNLERRSLFGCRKFSVKFARGGSSAWESMVQVG